MGTNGDVKVIKVAPRRSGGDANDESVREAGKQMILAVLNLMIDRPESTKVEYTVGERTTIYKIDCHPESLGQLIGSKGKNISGLRAVVAAAMARQGIRAIVEIPYLAPSSKDQFDE
ncbi:KH domain-containing protein [Bdellovibrio sp. HCB2-146]|uniref:KH domain-containing protein n=1 Tax=Bdellovibrio sp. HCB2-146 TaxID=3394362 RepID=UPI0039BC74EE